jgi:hypothetical protein
VLHEYHLYPKIIPRPGPNNLPQRVKCFAEQLKTNTALAGRSMAAAFFGSGSNHCPGGAPGAAALPATNFLINKVKSIFN